MRRILLAACVVMTFSNGVVAQDGTKIFKKCSACHSLDAPVNKVGPHLVGIIGRKAGSLEDYKYSAAMKDAGEAGLVWNEAMLSDYLLAPKARVPGTKMAFSGLKSKEDIATLIEYLRNTGK
jgi:cytochrome c